MLGIFLTFINSFLGGIWNTIKDAFEITATPLVAVGSLLVGAGLSIFAGGTLMQIALGGFAMAGLVQAATFVVATGVFAGISLYHWTKKLFTKEEQLIDCSEVKYTKNYEARRREAAESLAASGI